MNKALTHHAVKAEWVDDRNGAAVLLTQDEGGLGDAPDAVLLHPWQLRCICEQFGIILNSEASEKELATLRRRMLSLRDRVDTLVEWMQKRSDADLSFELVNLVALAELAGEWCADFDQPQGEGNG